MPKAIKKAAEAEAPPKKQPTPDDLTKLARVILKLKLQLKTANEAHEVSVKDIKSDIALCEQMFAEQAHKAGVTSVGTPEGVVGIGKRTFYKSDDIAALREYALANNEQALLSMTLSTTGLKEFIERNDGALPPTVYQAEIEEVYNRPSRKAKKALA